MGGAMADCKVTMRSGTQVPNFGSWEEAWRGLREDRGVSSCAEDKGPLPALTALLTAAM